jgi:predicted ATPase
MELLTHHAVRGEAWEKAVVYLREAGAKAFRRSANADAVSYFTKGLEIVERLPEGAGRRMVAFHRNGCHVIPHRQT